MAVARLFPLQPVSVGLVAAGWGVALTLSWLGWRRALTGRTSARLAATSLALSFGVPWVTLAACRSDPAVFSAGTAYREALGFLSEQLQPVDSVLLASYAQPLWFYTLNAARWPVEWVGLPWYPAPADALPPATRTLFEKLPPEASRVWLVNDLGAEPGGLKLEERWLAAQLSSAGEWEFADAQGGVRLNLFTAP